MTIELVDLRHASRSMQLRVREWRNAPHIQKFFQIEYITELMHLQWIESLFTSSPPVIAFLISREKQYVGLTYFQNIDYLNKTCDWGIYIYDVSLQSKGIGSIVLKKCLDYARDALLLESIYLDVRTDNLRAINLYKKNGFIMISDNGIISRYRSKINADTI